MRTSQCIRPSNNVLFNPKTKKLTNAKIITKIKPSVDLYEIIQPWNS